MAKIALPKWATTATPFSKFLAMALFILLPFLGFYIGILVEENHLSAPLTATKMIAYPTATPIPRLFIAEMPNELKVSRSVTPLYLKTNNPMLPFKTINDPAVVQKLYNTILALPPFPTPPPMQPPLAGHCVLDAHRVLYDLNFFKSDKLIRHGILSMTACSGGWSVSLDGTYKREFTDRNLFVPFRMLLESSFGVTASQLDGAEK